MTQEKQPTPIQTVQETLALLEQLRENIDYRTIVQLGWNLGWYQNIYYPEILEDHIYDSQAITLTIKVLQDILETHIEEE